MNKEFSWMLYLMLLAVVVISFTIPWLLPVSDFFKGISTIPGIGALSLAVIQIWRDKISHERKKELQREQHFFNLGVTSHMAKVAFDKHVEFCEKYIAQMNEGLNQLIIEGPNVDASSFAYKLSEIRFQFRAWLTEEITNKILPYEKVLNDIGAKSHLEEHLLMSEKRTRVIDEMFKAYSEVTGIAFDRNKGDEKTESEKIITHLQQVLGIQELTALRHKLITEAIKSISED